MHQRTLRVLAAMATMLACAPPEDPQADPIEVELSQEVIPAVDGLLTASTQLLNGDEPLDQRPVEFELKDALGVRRVSRLTTDLDGRVEMTFTEVRAAGVGQITVRVVGQKNEVTRDFRVTPGPPTAVKLTLEEAAIPTGTDLLFELGINDDFGNASPGAATVSTDAPGAVVVLGRVQGLTTPGSYSLTGRLHPGGTVSDTVTFDVVP